MSLLYGINSLFEKNKPVAALGMGSVPSESFSSMSVSLTSLLMGTKPVSNLFITSGSRLSPRNITTTLKHCTKSTSALKLDWPVSFTEGLPSFVA